MPTAILRASSHMDPLWRRGWCQHTAWKGSTLRPYGEIEDAQVLAWLDLAEATGIPYAVEQTATLRHLLETHPDELPRLRRLVQAGLIEPLGGGEMVPDTHLVDGETLVRNQTIGRRWLEQVLGVQPRGLTIPDAFGLSAQIPQLARGLGVLEVDAYARVFEQGERLWRGLDGSVVALTVPRGELPGVSLGGAGRYPPCPACAGDGCVVCGGSGLDRSENRRFDNEWIRGNFERSLDRALAGNPDTILCGLWGEEMIDSAATVATWRARLQERGLTVAAGGHEAVRHRLFAKLRAAVAAGHGDGFTLAEGVETRPIGTGCYLARTGLKQAVRALEDRLLSAEKLAALAVDTGEPYPRGALERCWRGMALLAFHDSITGTHTDGAARELAQTIREIRLVAHRLAERALAALAARHRVPTRAGWSAVLVFNPWNWAIDGEEVEHVLHLGPAEDAAGIAAEDADGRPLTVTAVASIPQRNGSALRVRLRGLRQPPLGLSLVWWRPAATPPAPTALDTQVLDNGCYRVEIRHGRIARVTDLALGQAIGGDAFGSLEIEQDLGSPWETLAEPAVRRCLSHERGITVRVERFPGGQRAVFSGTYANTDNLQVQRCAWQQELTLYDGERRLRFRTTVDWQGLNARVSALFPLTFRPPRDEARYEVPWGAVVRPSYRPVWGVHLGANGDWPALNSVTVHDPARDLTVSLLNRGLPANRCTGGELRLGLLRAPGEPLHVFDIAGAAESGTHEFHYAIESRAGSHADSRALHAGRAFNTTFPTIDAAPSAGPLVPGTPLLAISGGEALVIPVVKRGDEHDDLVVRGYDACGSGGTATFPDHRATACDLRERPVEGQQALACRPWGIATVRLGGNSAQRTGNT
jgi:alpha-mannosidase